VGNAPIDFEEFATARSSQLFRAGCVLTGDWYLAEDLVQETLGKLYQSWRRVSRLESPVAYANTVLVRTFLSHRRLRRTSEQPIATFPDVQHSDRDGALRVALLAGLATLSPKDRAVLVLRYWEDRSVEETAQALHLSVGAVRTQSHRALQRLRTILGDQVWDLAGQ
jgi:RNA polymerase sigma-70 factor (sigma-E family)